MKSLLKIITIVILISAFSYSYYLFNRTTDSSISGKKPDFKINTTNLVTAFEKDENNANTKYLGKIIQTEGEIIKIEASKSNNLILTLNTEKTLGNVIVHLSSNQSNELNNIKILQQISVKGICSGYLSDVVLVNGNKIKNQ